VVEELNWKRLQT